MAYFTFYIEDTRQKPVVACHIVTEALCFPKTYSGTHETMVPVFLYKLAVKRWDDWKRTSKSTLCLSNDGVDLDMMHFIDEEKLGTL